MSSKKRKSSRVRCLNRRKFLGSTRGTPTYIGAEKPNEDPIPLNRLAAKMDSARERGEYGAFVKKEQRTIRKERLKKQRRKIAKIRRETRKAMAARL